MVKDEEKDKLREYYRQYRSAHEDEISKYWNDLVNVLIPTKRIIKNGTTWGRTPNGKAARARRKLLGKNNLNKQRKGYHSHHIDNNNVIFIPSRIHIGIRHKLTDNESMKRINVIAWLFLETGAY